MPPQIIFIGVILVCLGSLSYILDTLKGKTKPNRVTWFFWALIPIIGSLISFQEGASIWQILPIFMAGFSPLLIFVSSFINKNAYWKLTTFDYVCGFLALLAIIFWLVAKNPIVAVILSLLADAISAVPTLRKTWIAPETETVWEFAASGFNEFLGLFILTDYGIVHSGFIILFLVIDLSIISIKFGRTYFLRSIRHQIDKTA